MAITGGVYERRIKDGLLVNLQSIYNMTQHNIQPSSLRYGP